MGPLLLYILFLGKDLPTGTISPPVFKIVTDGFLITFINFLPAAVLNLLAENQVQY